MMTANDGELAAMEGVKVILDKLDAQQRKRVLDWARSRFAFEGGSGDTNAIPPDCRDFAGMFNAANPRTNADRALVGGYWFQVVGGQKTFASQHVNTALKNLGHEVKNITDAFSSLMLEKPKLALQVRKGGSTKQARKQYRLTSEGITRVTSMLAGQNASKPR